MYAFPSVPAVKTKSLYIWLLWNAETTSLLQTDCKIFQFVKCFSMSCIAYLCSGYVLLGELHVAVFNNQVPLSLMCLVYFGDSELTSLTSILVGELLCYMTASWWYSSTSTWKLARLPPPPPAVELCCAASPLGFWPGSFSLAGFIGSSNYSTLLSPRRLQCRLDGKDHTLMLFAHENLISSFCNRFVVAYRSGGGWWRGVRGSCVSEVCVVMWRGRSGPCY